MNNIRRNRSFTMHAFGYFCSFRMHEVELLSALKSLSKTALNRGIQKEF